MPEITETYYARDRRAWRAWLQRHHARKVEIWLVAYKKGTGVPCVSYNDAVEEALCFGWIDSTRKGVDAERYATWFKPRKERSGWSQSNVKRVQRMIRAGKMTEAGLRLVRLAKRNGAWKNAYSASAPVRMPADLREALAQDARARERFAAMAPGYRRDYIRWVLDAKRAETRARRIGEVVRRAAQNKKPGQA